MATINSQAFNDGSGNRFFQFEYTTSKYAQGITRVDWTFKSCYTGSTSERSIYCNCSLSAAVGNGSLYSGSLPSYSQGWTYTSFNNGASYSGGASHYVNQSGTFYVKHNTSGNASINIYISASIYSQSSNYSNSGTISLTGNAPYSNVTKPTSVSCNVSIAKPGSTITISWSGAKAGTNNPIKSYYIAASYNAYPSSGANIVLSKTVTSSSGSGSVTFTVPEDRGKKLQFEIQVKGTYNNTALADSPGAVCIINTLPAKPTVTVNKSIVPSAGGDVKFTVSAGADSQTGQTRTLYYATSSTGTKTKFTSPLTKNISSASTLYFWTWDGLEFSKTYTSQKISINKKPTVSLTDEGKSEKYNGTTYITDLIYTSTVSKNDVTYEWKIVNKTTGTSKSIGSDTTKNINIKPWKYGVGIGQVYYIQVRVHDGIEWSSTVKTSEKTIPSTAKVLKTYNQHSEKNISGTNGEFYDKIRVYLPIDTYLKNAKTVTATTNLGTVKITNKTECIFDISNLSSLNKGENTFTITIDSDGLKRSYTFSKNKTDIVSIKNFIGTTNLTAFEVINKEEDYPTPFSYNITNYNSDFYNTETKTFNYTKYNIKEEGIKLIFSYDGKIVEKVLSENEVDIKTTTNDTIFFNIGIQTLKDIINTFNLGGSTKTIGIITIPTKIEITNLFGIKSVSSLEGNLKINTKDILECQNMTTEIKIINEEIFIKPTEEINNSFCEDNTIIWDYKISTYNKINLTANIYICESSTSMKDIEITDDLWELYKTITIPFSSQSSTYPYEINYTIEEVIKEIVVSNYIYFKIVITNNNGGSFESGKIIMGPSTRHTIPTIEVNNIKYDKTNKIINVKGKITDGGGGIREIAGSEFTSLDDNGKITFQINSKEEDDLSFRNYNYSNIYNVENREFEFSIPVERFNIPSFSTELRVINQSNKKIKTGIFEITVYNLNPTVALRKNHLGINTDFFEEEEVLVITPAEGRKLIVIKDEDGNKIIINMLQKTIDGITIDGGNW